MQPIARRQKGSRVLEGAVLGNLFFEASTRTRVSFGAAFCRLGGSVCDTTGFTFSSMAKGESIYDTSRVMSGYVDAMVIRHPEKGSVARSEEHTSELQSLMRISYAVFCLKKKKNTRREDINTHY